MMKCPFCNQENTRVIDSRPVQEIIRFADADNAMNVINASPRMKR